MTGLKEHITRLRGQATESRKVLENYFFMTLLQVLNMCFYILIYPFLIRRLGAEGYGLYAYAASLTMLFITWVNFGFDLPSAKKVAEHSDDRTYLSGLISTVWSAKWLLWAAGTVVFCIVVALIPMLRSQYVIFALVYLQTISFIFFPQWYFQGLQKMRIVTYIQLSLRILSLPLIFLLIRTPEDTWLFALITTLTSLGGAFIALVLMFRKDGIRIHPAAWDRVKQSIREASPFFATNATGIIKEQGVVLMTGALLGMTDVAIYDLANKIVIIPRTIFSKLNDAIYPDMMVRRSEERVHRVLKTERLLGVLSIVAVAVFGPLAVYILGGETMMAAYGVSILLSVTILSWLIAGAYIQFCFIPAGRSNLILENQILAAAICLGITAAGLLMTHSVYAPAAGVALSGIAEMVFCRIMAKKHRML